MTNHSPMPITLHAHTECATDADALAQLLDSLPYQHHATARGQNVVFRVRDRTHYEQVFRLAGGYIQTVNRAPAALQ